MHDARSDLELHRHSRHADSSDSSRPAIGAVIEALELTKRRRPRFYRRAAPVVEQVSFSVMPGEVVGFLGPNGAGKSTTMRMLAGVCRPSSGEVRINGSELSLRTQRRIGSLIESPALYPWMTAQGNAALLAPRAKTDDRSDVLERMRLNRTTPVSKFSQGMKQKLAIAIALLNGREGLILDEPTNGLDPAATKDFFLLVAEAREAGKAVLISSHQLSALSRSCDRVVLLNAGRVVTSGTLADLRADQEWLEVRSAQTSTAHLRDALGTHFYCEAALDGHSVLVDAQNESEVESVLKRSGIEAFVQRIEVTLEDRFLALTEHRSN